MFRAQLRTVGYVVVHREMEKVQAVAYPRLHFGGINLTKFYPVIAHDISKKNVVMQVQHSM